MRISILSVGSRGDAQPYVALGEYLATSGHDVTLATHSPFRTMAAGRGIRFVDLPGDPREVIQTEKGEALVTTGRSMVRYVRRFAALLQPWWWRLVEAVTPVCESADLIVYSPLAFAGWHLGRALNTPTVFAALQPFTPTREFPMVTLGGRHFGSMGNLLTHRVAEQLAWNAMRRPVDNWRVNHLGLAPLGWKGPYPQLRTSREPRLFAYSSHVSPRPSDWGPEHTITGYWFLDEGEQDTPSDLSSFLSAGDPPVYIGFGSIASRDADRITDLVLKASRKANHRLVVSSGWGGLIAGGSTDQVLFIGETPHARLFPAVRAVVHHGGAGTTGAAFRAGVPQIIVPFSADQPFWGWRVAATGVGPPPIPHTKLTVDLLSAALDEVTTNISYRRAAAAIGDLVTSEDGLKGAADVLRTIS